VNHKFVILYFTICDNYCNIAIFAMVVNVIHTGMAILGLSPLPVEILNSTYSLAGYQVAIPAKLFPIFIFIFT